MGDYETIQALAADLAAANARIAELEARLASLTSVSEEDVERAGAAMYRDEAWSSFWSSEDAKKLARAALTAYVSR